MILFIMAVNTMGPCNGQEHPMACHIHHIPILRAEAMVH